MKKSIKLLILAAAMLFGTQAFGQVTITAGYQQPSYSVSGLSETFNGFYAGVLTQVHLADMFYFEPGLLFDFGADDGSNVSYLRLPLHLGAGFALGNGFELFANAGPGIAIGLFGQYGPDDADNADDFFKFFKRFDINLGLEGGLRLNDRYEFRIGYDWGLLNQVEDAKVRRGVMHVGLAYRF